mmetsp:Transcript_5938/g.18436  ORF Transcript_5938/g.18436 Transcript_5938/m.18436 type:complete len:249 (+) Transcript_5938:28-774(+)
MARRVERRSKGSLPARRSFWSFTASSRRRSPPRCSNPRPARRQRPALRRRRRPRETSLLGETSGRPSSRTPSRPTCRLWPRPKRSRPKRRGARWSPACAPTKRSTSLLLPVLARSCQPKPHQAQGRSWRTPHQAQGRSRRMPSLMPPATASRRTASMTGPWRRGTSSHRRASRRTRRRPTGWSLRSSRWARAPCACPGPSTGTRRPGSWRTRIGLRGASRSPGAAAAGPPLAQARRRRRGGWCATDLK